jgi:hypothetical protein
MEEELCEHREEAMKYLFCFGLVFLLLLSGCTSGANSDSNIESAGSGIKNYCVDNPGAARTNTITYQYERLDIL